MLQALQGVKQERVGVLGLLLVQGAPGQALVLMLRISKKVGGVGWVGKKSGGAG
jgi:hypothetical protein